MRDLKCNGRLDKRNTIKSKQIDSPNAKNICARDNYVEKIRIEEKKVSKILCTLPEEDRKTFVKFLNENPNNDIKRAYREYTSKINSVHFKSQWDNAYYQPWSNILVFTYPTDDQIDSGRTKFAILCHEYGHFIDTCGFFSGLSYREINSLNLSFCTLICFFKTVPSSSDQFLKAVRCDKENLSKLVLDTCVRNDLFSTAASVGIQDALDGMFGSKVGMHWQHGDEYYNRKFKEVVKYGLEKSIKEAYKKLGFDVGDRAKVMSLVRNYETASEIWANIMSAATCGGRELDYVKKYLPNSYSMYLKIMKELK